MLEKIYIFRKKKLAQILSIPVNLHCSGINHKKTNKQWLMIIMHFIGNETNNTQVLQGQHLT